MNIRVGLPVVWGLLAGLAAAVALAALYSLGADYLTFGGISDVGQRMTLTSFLSNAMYPALVLGGIGALIGLVISNRR